MERLSKGVVFVVEGKNDFAKLKQVLPGSRIIITNGSEISETTIDEIKVLSKVNRIILLLDPDGPGEKIRRKISDNIPSAEHVYVLKHLAISSNKKKVGIEHLSEKDLLDALREVKVPNSQDTIKMEVLFELGLVGKKDSKILRQNLCDSLGIGTANAKTLLYKLNMFGYSIDDIKEIILR